MSIFNLPDEEFVIDSRSKTLMRIGVLAAGVMLAGVVAYLLTTNRLIYVLILIAVPVGILFIHRYPFATIPIWLMLTPLLTFPIYPGIRQVFWIVHRALPPVTLIIIFAANMLGIYKRRLPKIGIAEWFMIGYVVVSILSIYVFNPKPIPTFYLLYDRTIAPIFLYLVVRFCSPNQKDIQRLLPVLFFIVISQSVIGLLSWTVPGTLPRDWLDEWGGMRTTGSLAHPSVYSATMIFCGLFLLHAGMGQRSRAARTIYFAVFTLTLAFDFLTFARAAWLGGILVLMGIAIIYPRFATGLATATLVISMLFGAVLLTQFSWVIDQASERLNGDAAQTSAFSRLPVYYAATRMFLEKPILGWGYENFNRYDYQFYNNQVGSFVGDNKDHASHNFLLTLLAEQGATGFLLFLGPIIYWLIQTIKWRKKNLADGLPYSKLPALLWLAVLNLIILINFSNLRVSFGWGIWWLTLALIAAMIHPMAEDKSTSLYRLK